MLLNDSALILDNAPPYVLTRSKTRHCQSWGDLYYPAELNLILNVPGDDISFVASDEVKVSIFTYSLFSNEKMFGIKDSAGFFLRKLYEKLTCIFRC